MSRLELLFLLSCFPYLFHISDGGSMAVQNENMPPSSPIRAVNLGGWLVTEGWFMPSLFYDIINNETLDGTKLQFKSVTQNMYLSAEHGGGSNIVANRTNASTWETFKLWRINEDTFNLKVDNNQFVTLAGDGVTVVASVPSPGSGEKFQFQMLRNSIKQLIRVRIKALNNGMFLQASTDLVTADYDVQSTNWGDDDPSVFEVKIKDQLQGEYQLCNGYVRIPVGWWIASDPNPPAPFVGGSLEALDNAFIWAEKYNVGVIVDLHAAPGSQNQFEHSGTRDGSYKWATATNIAQTVHVIGFLASRYANSSSLLAIELLNEPQKSNLSDLSALKGYYQDGYYAVRNHTEKAYVIMSTQVYGANTDTTELLDFASNLPNTVIDVHYYNLYADNFKTLTAEQHIEYVNTTRSAELRTVTRQNGPLSFVGEWVAEWDVQTASKEDYQKFAQVQLDVYGRATFGWAYWTYKHVNEHWSMEWNINNKIISLKT
uniref:Uncharacterized protein n=1 Tax=Leersia perrieri TaxID=77586 RepID=A0A0D9XJ32_9ORYZ